MSISVTVKFFTTLREIVGKKEEKIELCNGADLDVLLHLLSEKYGQEFSNYVYDELGNVRSYLQFLISGKSAATLQGLKTKLKEGDQVAILPPVGGG